MFTNCCSHPVCTALYVCFSEGPWASPSRLFPVQVTWSQLTLFTEQKLLIPKAQPLL